MRVVVVQRLEAPLLPYAGLQMAPMVLAAVPHQLVGTAVERYEVLDPLSRLDGRTRRDIRLPTRVE